ncbi:Ribosomal RNA small subunit methyltransferase G [[Clostridium] ultunense Esp]|uniref:Ribosomal RNA small subunit methyltransferase G n=1 Tax=[Clostridium] ultunense Esp TaxID=1288971 RepID=M1ZE60_9FIRM|nr:16S rRNA (guanine(527)-N(7))-methyltransferase RsmG [Schnuerera ultunensis]CCQ96936.1 Ribosomal RNA small subunit methyltransferase G [[Clostridium] ultunense Esp]SHD78046.1 7-methylguanosine methyltransferase (16S rRNA, nucleotide G527) [[Clostridium] ultunense Esp]
MTNVNTLIKGANVLGIELNKDEIDSFILYKELLKEWNQKINITSITDDEEIDIKHFIDSITPLSTDLFAEDVRMIDIGTGGGFPGIPLKIINRDMEVVLLDSLKKRITFLEDIIDKLALEKIFPIHGRAEELGRDKNHREKYDIAISRAVASLNTLSEYCLPFVKVGGFFISMKGPDVDEELKEAEKSIKILGGNLNDVKVVNLPLSDITHSLIIIEKIKGTPTKYPRGGGKPKKKPL